MGEGFPGEGPEPPAEKLELTDIGSAFASID
jgi:hypothetical protein